MPVPEAAMDQNQASALSKDNVGHPGQTPIVEAKAISQPMQ
jgi:hypothetical protein